MEWKARRVLTKNGNSRTVVIPREFLQRMNLMLGEALDLIYDDEKNILKIKSAEGHQSGVRAVRHARAPREVHE